jgi:4-amino-4-deoxy-L-arabinose transferase-like glycosyltransferase
MFTPIPGAVSSLGRPWWREAEAGWLVVLVLVAYFARAADLPLRGEEPTRAQIAFEMIEQRDWVAPREQGELFLIRPPLQNWLIAGTSLVLGQRGAGAVRFPSLAATLLTTLLIYGYSRTLLARPAALASGVAFATMGEMLQTGRQAETEALFILLVSSSLLTWHWGQVRRWPSALTWAAGYGLMSLAALTKGMQAPVYFLGAVFGYLLVTGQWRRLFSLGHLVGVLVGAALIALWVVPYYFEAGWPAVHAVWFGDPALRPQIGQLPAVAAHAAVFPFIVFGCMLPWSPLLLLYLSRSIWQPRPQIIFLAIAVAVAFPTCWLHPGGQSRFFTPLYPCLAVLIGWAIQQVAEAEPSSWLRVARAGYLAVVSGVMIAAAVAVPAVSCARRFYPELAAWAEPLAVAAGYAAVASALALFTWRARRGDQRSLGTAVVSLGIFMVITFTGVITDYRLRRSEDAAVTTARLKEKLPGGQQLVSLGGHTDSLFAYHFGFPIILPRPWPKTDHDPGSDAAYFSFVSEGTSRPGLPFPWEEIGTVSLDRNHREPPERVVVVGRRLPAARVAAAKVATATVPEQSGIAGSARP